MYLSNKKINTYLLCWILCALFSCYNTKYLQQFNLSAPIPDHSVIPERDRQTGSVYLFGNITLCPDDIWRYNNGQHSTVNGNGIFVLDTIDTFSNGSSYIFDVITDSTGLNKFQGYNVDWNVPHISGLLGLDWRIARFFSFQSELGLSVIDKHLFFRLLAGPAFHLHSDKIGARIGVCLGLMNYSYNLVYLAKEFSLGESSFSPQGDFWLFTEKMDDAFAPYLDAYATINTMQEFVGMNYFANIGYERMNYYVERELYGDDLKVRFSFFSLQVGVFKQIGNWTVTGSGGYKFENRWHFNTDTLSRSYKVNASDKAVIPLFNISAGYDFGEKQNAALRRKK